MRWILTDSQRQTVDQTELPANPSRPPLAQRVRVVLVGTTHPGNIGSTARAMKAMGLSQLHLVAPECAADETATALAVGAADLLRGAQIHRTLAEALVGLSRFALVWLGGLPVFLGLMLSGAIQSHDLFPLMVMPFVWGAAVALGLTAWVYEPVWVRRIGELFRAGQLEEARAVEAVMKRVLFDIYGGE